jgi:hypothetical protein
VDRSIAYPFCGNNPRSISLDGPDSCLIWALPEKEMCAILHSRETIEPKAALPLLYFTEGSSSPSNERKGGDTMYVTYQDLIQIGILVVALANLIYQVYKGKKK